MNEKLEKILLGFVAALASVVVTAGVIVFVFSVIFG